MNNSIIVAALGLTLAVGCAFDAIAASATVSRYDYQSAVGLCQGNSATYASNLRFRPLSADNIGTTNQFISCGFQGDDNPLEARGATQVFVRVANNDTVSHDIQCILVNGYRQGSVAEATYTTKTVTLAPGTSDFIVWVPGDVTPAVTTMELPQVQCLLPAKTALDYTGKTYVEDISA